MNARVAVEHAAVRYGGRHVFSDVTLALYPGTFTAIIGPNGSGKSSLLRLLAGVQKPDAGSATRSGGVSLVASSVSPPPDVTPSELADYGLALRRPWWRFTPRAADLETAKSALARTGLLDRADDPIGTLSDGEVQRTWIAAALASGSQTLLIDEPTSHLDLRYQLDVLTTLKSLTSGGVAVAAAVHDLTLAARFADTIALIAGGHLVSGSPAEILEPRAVSSAFGIAVSIYPHPTEGYLVCMPR